MASLAVRGHARARALANAGNTESVKRVTCRHGGQTAEWCAFAWMGVRKQNEEVVKAVSV